MRRARAAGLAAALTLLLPASTASGDQQITANPVDSYGSPDVTTDQGERLTFANNDVPNHYHDVTARGAGPDGRSLFDTPIIGPGQTHFVDGSQYLTTGDYQFYCSVHPFMTGTLHVTSNGTPVPRPADTTPPSVHLSILGGRLRSVLRARRISVRVQVDEKAGVSLSGSARVGRRSASLGSASASLSGPGTETVSFKLTRSARRALRHARRARVSVTGTATDAAGNNRTASASRTLRR